MELIDKELNELKGFIADLKADRAAQKEKEKRESWTKYTSMSIVFQQARERHGFFGVHFSDLHRPGINLPGDQKEAALVSFNAAGSFRHLEDGAGLAELGRKGS
jgi:hypothetical protein